VADEVGHGRALQYFEQRIERSFSRASHVVVFVDDILDTGGTLVSCCRQLRDAGVQQIGVIATHGLFTGEHWRAAISEGVQQIWITDTVRSRRRPKQAEIVPVAPLLASLLEGISE